MTNPRRLRRLTNKEIHQIAEDEIPIALERLMGGDHDARAIALAELTTFARAIIDCMATTPAPGDPALEIGELHPASRIIALYSNPGQIEPGPFSEHDLRQQWNAQADELNQWESLDSSEQLAWAQTRAIAADRFLPPVAKPTPVDLAALHDPNFSGGLTPDQHLEVLWGGPDPRVAATTHTIPVAWCRSDDFRDAAQTRQSLVTWREQHPDCDMALYAHSQAGPAQSTGPSLEEVGPLIAWLAEAAVQSANAGASKNAGMLTWAAQVVGQRVDEDAPAADQAEGPSLADVDWLCAEFGFHYDDDESQKILHNMITVAITRWRAPVAQAVATPAPEEPETEHVLRLAAIIREVDGRHDLGAAALAEAILAHPGFSGCHDGPAALPVQGELEELVEFLDGLAGRLPPDLRHTAELLKGLPALPAPGFQIGPQEYIPHA